MDRFYFDASASYPLRESARQSLCRCYQDICGNSGSIHSYGQASKTSLEQCRQQIASLMGCYADEIVFTSGGTESCHLAIRGVMAATEEDRRWVSASLAEHPAVLYTTQACDHWQHQVIDVDKSASPILDEAKLPSGGLICMMAANNEVGTLSDLERAHLVAQRTNSLLFVDAVQSTGTIPVNLDSSGIDLLAASSHKFGGPLGIGFLYVRRGTPFKSPSTGGGQEAGRRSGTVNVSGIVSMTAALSESLNDRKTKNSRLISLRNQLIDALQRIDGVQITGHLTNRLPGHVSCVIENVAADVALAALDASGVCAGSGSACSSGRGKPSSVLLAIGIEPKYAASALRFSFGDYITDTQFEQALALIQTTIQRLSALR